jgi:trk system potassium uptake protein TrkH
MHINTPTIYRILGSLLFLETSLLFICLFVALWYDGNDVPAFIYTILISILCGVFCKMMGRNADNSISRKDGYIVVSLTWIIFSFVGMLPFVISGYIPNISDAFFETMSGFTTTGATILDNIESLPAGLLFWRSLTQWIGGLGIIFITIAIFPSFGNGGLRLFSAEATGPLHDKLHPRISTNAKWIWSVYITLTVATAVALFMEGMSCFESICHAFTSTATGGYSTRQESIAAYHSPVIEYTIAASMFLSGINFSLLYFSLLKGKILRLFQDSEFRCYLLCLAGFTLICTFSLLYYNGYDLEHAFRSALFQVVSIQTSTGYASDDYMLWPSFLHPFLLLMMVFGACSGSSTGGIKCIRLNMVYKVVRNQFRNIIQPNAVLPVRINRSVMPEGIKSSLLAFFTLYVMLAFMGWIAFMLMGETDIESIGLTISSLGNCGPAMGNYGPAYSWASLPDIGKWIASLLMLAGRLEIFPILILFSQRFWRDY